MNDPLKEHGETMRQNRILLGLSIREAADRAGISKNTILRLEAGLPVTRATHRKLSQAYGRAPISPEQRRTSAVEGKHYRLHTLPERVWIPTRIGKDGRAEIIENPRAGEQDERNRMGWYGLATHFGSPLRCRREGSRFIPFIVEVFAPTDVTSDASGERFLFGLRGRVRVQVGDEEFELGEGEAATYDATQPSGMEPALPVRPGDPAPVVLQLLVP